MEYMVTLKCCKNRRVLVGVAPANNIEAESRMLPAGVSLISGCVGQAHCHVQELHMATKVIIVPNLWTEVKKKKKRDGVVCFNAMLIMQHMWSNVVHWSGFLAATKQLYKWYCPYVRPSVCHTFFTMFPSSYHHEIFRSYYHSQKWCPCKRSRSKVKVTEVNTQLSRFRTLNSSLNSHMAMKSCTQLETA